MRPTWRVEVQPPLEDGLAAPVLRILVRAEPFMKPEEWSIFKGSVTARERKELAAGTPTKALLARKVPVLSWDRGGEVELAPMQVLELGATYSVVGIPIQFVYVVQVRQVDTMAIWTRVWPPDEGASTAARASWCLNGKVVGDAIDWSTDSELWPGPVAGRLSAGAVGTAGSDCVRWEAEDSEARGPLIGPPLVHMGDRIARLEPTALQWRAGEGNGEVKCEHGASPFAFACALVSDDRMTILSAGEPWLVEVRVNGRVWGGLLDASHPLVVRPLPEADAVAG